LRLAAEFGMSPSARARLWASPGTAPSRTKHVDIAEQHFAVDDADYEQVQ
jgi:phage terminase small subunit